MPTGYNPGGKAIGTPAIALTGTPSAGQVPTATSATAATWQAAGGGGGATIPSTVNLIKGDGAGNGADSGIDPDSVAQQLAPVAVDNLTGWNTASALVDAGVSIADAQSGIPAALAVKGATGIILSNGTNSIVGITDLPDGTTATTQTPSDSSTKLATTAFVQSVVVFSQSSAIQKGNGTGGFDNAVPGDDFLAPDGDISGTSGTNADIDGAISSAISLDTGWTANAGDGDKTVVVQNYDSTTLDGMTAALNLVLAGFGTAIAQLADQVEALTKKFQAMERALADRTLPNA